MPIRTIVVLMLENRSFDHMLGFSRTNAFPINGLAGTETNALDPFNATSPVTTVSDVAQYVPDLDPSPGHDFQNVVRQIHGASPPPSPARGSNIGFVADYATVASARAGEVMRCYAADKLPVLHTLAQQFAVCDGWFSSLPGPTWPNRLFAHCATSAGYVDGTVRVYNMRSIYDNLERAGINWRIYYHDMPQSLSLAGQRKYFRTKYELFDEAFIRDCHNGLLPQYCFIEPRYFNHRGDRANDQHPIHGVVGGEELIASVYEALRASPQWNECMLIVTWDEHGGFYDHAPPPAATPPDQYTQTFDFASCGVRVPAIVVSPLIPPTIERRFYDHASIPATVKTLFGLPNFLTARDAHANTLEHLAWLEQPRTDTPTTLPRPSAPAATGGSVADGSPNELQDQLLTLARELTLGIEVPHLSAMAPPASEQQAAAEVRAHIDALRKRL